MNFFGKKPQQPGWLAMRISATEAMLAHVTRETPGKPKVVWCDAHRLDGKNGEALERLRKELHLERYRCIGVLHPSEYQLLLVEAPNVPPAELKTAMRWRIKDLLDYHVDDATVDVLDIPVEKNASRSHSMYAIAARNDTIQKCVSMWEEAKLPLSVIDIPETAQRNIAFLYEEEGRALALLSFNGEGGLLTVTCHGELYLTRRIEVSAGQLLDADETLRQQSLDRVALELQRSLDHFDRQYHYLPLNKLLLAPCAEPGVLLDYLSANLYVTVETLELGEKLDLSAVPELSGSEGQAQYFQVVGAALRQEEKVL